MIYPLCLMHRVKTYHTCELNVEQCWQFFVWKYFLHNEEKCVYLVLCIHQISLDFYFHQQIGQIFWRLTVLAAAVTSRYQSKNYPTSLPHLANYAEAVIFVNLMTLVLPPFQGQAEMTSQISFSCLKLSHSRFQG